MQFTIDSAIFDSFPDAGFGAAAVKGIDNLTADPDIEAFLRHASLEAGLLLKLKPIGNDKSILAYREALAKIGAAEVVSPAERTIRRFEEGLLAASESGLQFVPGQMTGLEGAMALPRENPVMDLVHGAELQFRMPVLAFDVGKDEAPLSLTRTASGDIAFVLGGDISVPSFLGEQTEKGRVSGETRNLLLVIPCFGVNRRKAMSLRNELARRLKDSFGRTSEAAWLSGEEREFVSKI